MQIGGSFFTSTANSFKFPDGSEFSTISPQSPPLLTVNLTPELQHGRPIGTITQAGYLAVPIGQSLTLFGSTVTSTGTLTAPGGVVQVLGNRVALLDQAQIDVSSPTKGGTVLVGGYRGSETVPNAAQTFVGSNVTINADATTQGNGGRVIVWADKTTRFYGTIGARGGQLGGAGGFVEVSGGQDLDFQGRVDTSAALAQTGTLLLDPTNLIVIAGIPPIHLVRQMESGALLKIRVIRRSGQMQLQPCSILPPSLYRRLIRSISMPMSLALLPLT